MGRRAMSVIFKVICYARVWRIIVSSLSRILRAVAAVVSGITILNVCWRSWALLCCVWKLPNFSRDQSVHLKTQQRGRAEKPGLRDVKRAGIIRYWRRSGLKNPDKPQMFKKKNVTSHSYHQFFPVLEKIRINRGLLYFLKFWFEENDTYHGPQFSVIGVLGGLHKAFM